MEKLNVPKNGSRSELESIAAWRKIIDKIDHLFVNNLAILRSKHDALNQIMPSLLKAYHVAIENKLMDPEIDPKSLEHIYEKANLKDQTESMFQILDSVHSFCEKLIKIDHIKQNSAKICIAAVLDTYEFKNNERELIKFNGDSDFNFSISEFFLNSALVQLLYFAFNSFKESPKKKIEIFFSNKNGDHTIHFKISCSEIQTQYNHFFENSLSIFPDNIIPGINFCRLAFLNAGGNMTYQAVEGKEVEFVISLP